MTVLSTEQIKLGRQKTLENAECLFKEAQALFDIGHYPRVVFLSHVAGEEISKYIMLTTTMVKIISDIEIDWKKFWKRFTSHKEKLELILFMEDEYFEKTLSKDFKEYFKNLREQVKELDYFKQISLYSDFIESSFLSPSEIINKQIAEDALGWANGRIKLFVTMENEFKRKKILDKLTKDTIKDYIEKYWGKGLG